MQGFLWAPWNATSRTTAQDALWQHILDRNTSSQPFMTPCTRQVMNRIPEDVTPSWAGCWGPPTHAQWAEQYTYQHRETDNQQGRHPRPRPPSHPIGISSQICEKFNYLYLQICVSDWHEFDSSCGQQQRLRGWSRMMVKQFQDGGRPPFWKSIYRHILVNKLSCRRDRATLRVIEYFAKSPKVTQGHSK